jgi:hypothetical protein
MHFSAARHRARGIYDGHCHPFRSAGVKGWRRRPTARRRCDRPVPAGRSTALTAMAPLQPWARPADRSEDKQGRQPILQPNRNPGEADSTPLPAVRWRIVTDHPSLRHPPTGTNQPLHILPAEYALGRALFPAAALALRTDPLDGGRSLTAPNAALTTRSGIAPSSRVSPQRARCDIPASSVEPVPVASTSSFAACGASGEA